MQHGGEGVPGDPVGVQVSSILARGTLIDPLLRPCPAAMAPLHEGFQRPDHQTAHQTPP